MTQLWEIKIVVTSHVSHHHTLGYRLDLQRRRKKKKRILPTTFVLKTDKENNWTLRRFLGHSETQSAVCRFHVHVCTVSHGCYFAGVGCKTIFWQCVGLRGCHIPCNLSQIPSPHTHTHSCFWPWFIKESSLTALLFSVFLWGWLSFLCIFKHNDKHKAKVGDSFKFHRRRLAGKLYFK